MSEYQTFSMGENDSHIGGFVKPFKAEAGRSYRVGFAYWPMKDGKPDLSNPPLFVGKKVNFIQGAGYVINKGEEFTRLAGSPPKDRIVSLLFIYPTDKGGLLDTNRFKEGDFEVKPWVLSADKYTTLTKIHKEWPFGQHDFTIFCSDANFQKMTFTPCKESLLAKLMASKDGEALLNKALSAMQNAVAQVPQVLGQDLTIQQLREKLSGAPAGAHKPVDAATSSAVDSFVGDLLED